MKRVLSMLISPIIAVVLTLCFISERYHGLNPTQMEKQTVELYQTHVDFCNAYIKWSTRTLTAADGMDEHCGDVKP